MVKVRYRYNTKTFSYEQAPRSLFNKLSNHFLTKVLVGIITFFGTILGIYSYFEKKNVLLQYEVLTNTNVLDINANVSKLDILYDSISLKKKKQNLRVVTIRLVNRGQVDVLKDFFDDNSPLGVKIVGGEIVESPELIEASSDYLSKNIHMNKVDRNTVLFSNVIIEKGEFLVFKALVLHNSNSQPSVESIGKVAGEKIIPVINIYNNKVEKSILTQAFEGRLTVQLIRAFTYLIVGIATIIAIIIAFEQIIDWKTRLTLKRVIRQFKKQSAVKLRPRDEVVFNRFKSDGIEFFRLIKNKNFSEDTINDLKRNQARSERFTEQVSRKHYMQSRKYAEHVIDGLIEDGVIVKGEDGRFKYNMQLRSTMDNFIDFLEVNNMFDAERD